MDERLKYSNGITLVALVITIIILLILATISIQSLTNTGLFKNAQKAKEETNKAIENQEKRLNEYEEELNKYISGTVKEEKDPIKEVANKVLSTTDNTELTDANAKTIELNRYTFGEDGNPTPQDENAVGNSFQELETSNKGNTVAKSISGFKTSVATNGGYYIGRHEARKNSTTGKVTVVKTDSVWNNITQPDAAIQARNMYDNTHPFTSDLINSYAWDTATLFLQYCGNNSTPYSIQNSLNTGAIATTGTTNDVQCNVYDMASNLWEWSTETSDESDNGEFVFRGGSYKNSSHYTITRHGKRNISTYIATSATYFYEYITFRILLYL